MKKGSSNSVENPFLIFYRFLQRVPQKSCKLFFRWNRPPVVSVLFSYFLSHQLWETVELLMFILKKKPWDFSSSSSRSRYKWLNIPNSGLFMLIECTHMFRLLRRHLLLQIIVFKTSMLTFFHRCRVLYSSTIQRVLKTHWNSRVLYWTRVGEHPPWL